MMRFLKKLCDDARRRFPHLMGRVYVPIDDVDGCRIICSDCNEVVWSGPPGSFDGVDFEVLVSEAKKAARQSWSRGERP